MFVCFFNAHRGVQFGIILKVLLISSLMTKTHSLALTHSLMVYKYVHN